MEAKTRATTDNPTGPGGASRVLGERHDALTPESQNDLIFTKVQGILNKLTPKKFAKLSNDLLNVELNSHMIFKGVVIMIFEKMLEKPKYSSMYARLCKQLSDEAANLKPRKPIDESQKGQNIFRFLLLNKCRYEFENRSKASEAFENQDELGPEEEERRQVDKRKMLRNIKFIGELGKVGIVSEPILHKCIQQLLEEKRREGPPGVATVDIECVCQIMRTCGSILDSDKGRNLMDQYFKRHKYRIRSAMTTKRHQETNINLNLPLNNDLFPGRGSDMPFLRTTALRLSSPLLHKETPPTIVIKQGPVDKREKANGAKFLALKIYLFLLHYFILYCVIFLFLILLYILLFHSQGISDFSYLQDFFMKIFVQKYHRYSITIIIAFS